MKVYDSVLELIGNTPLVRINRMNSGAGTVLAKLEYFNPLSSVKDRAAASMIEAAERNGLLAPGALIIEPTSGNTGIALAGICAVKGYSLILTMPETMSMERRTLLKALGAQLVLTEGAKGMNGAIAKAEELLAAHPGAYMPQQFQNKANAHAHYTGTGPEIWQDTDGTVDILVTCVGTGGTLTGTAAFLKEKNPRIHIVAVEPTDSAVLSGKPAGPHKIQGIGAGFVPDVLKRELIDEVYPANAEKAAAAAREAARTEGIFAGISSGAALEAALTLAKRPENAKKTIVAVLPDTGERYLSTWLWQ